MLKPLGVEIEIARNGLEALTATEHVHYDLVLMDCQMPELDGFDATRRIRMREAVVSGARQIIVAMTANAMSGDRERCREAGMDDYMAKPVDRLRLYEMVTRWVAVAPAESRVEEI